MPEVSNAITSQVLENGWVLAVLALLPAVILCVYVFIKDRAEKEPIGLLLTLLAFGALSAVPAIIGETVLDGIINATFDPYILEINEDGNPVFSGWTPLYLYYAASAFIGVALVEELGKWVFMVRRTRKNKHFNSLFDGIIYAVFVSLGFAALENVLYVVSGGAEDGLRIAIMRAIMSVPGHMFFGVFMGIYYSFWKISDRAFELEQELAAMGHIQITKPIDRNKGKLLSIVVPVLVHGFYDFCLFVGSVPLVISFYIFLVVMYVVCFKQIRRFSKADRGIDSYAYALLSAKYRARGSGEAFGDQLSTLSDIVENTADQFDQKPTDTDPT